jgi:replicative DNA helicase
MKRDKGLGAIFIDYLQLMNDDPGNLSKQDGRTQEMANISRSLKAIAKEFDVPIFALAQLNRTVESRAEKVPRMSDLRESGSIEQDADVVILLNRPEYYSIDKNNPERPGEADIIIAKNRHGDVGTAEMMFIKNMMTFAEKNHDE